MAHPKDLEKAVALGSQQKPGHLEILWALVREVLVFL